jgi:hypothetical protein
MHYSKITHFRGGRQKSTLLEMNLTPQMEQESLSLVSRVKKLWAGTIRKLASLERYADDLFDLAERNQMILIPITASLFILFCFLVARAF